MEQLNIKRIENWRLHDSQRGWFGFELYKQMAKNKDIFLITMDLGFGLFDNIKEDFPDRFFNVGASEMSGIGIGVGLALEGKIPVCYSITPFLLYRPFEWIRNYLDHEKIPVILAGSGNLTDYGHDGFTHHCPEVNQVMDIFKNIKQYYPKDKDEVPVLLDNIIKSKQPSFICLRQ